VHSLTVVFGPASWQFMFRSKEKAEQYAHFRNDHPTQDLIIDDDFGQHAEIRASSIHGIQIENLEESRLVHVERVVHDIKIRSAAQQRAQREPALSRVMPVLNGGVPGG
jgi:hypothetical protein